MNNSILFILIVVTLCSFFVPNIASQNIPVAYAEKIQDIFEEKISINYSPYHGYDNNGRKYDPIHGPYPSFSEIEEDVKQLSFVSNHIRTYSTLGNLKKIASLGEKYGVIFDIGMLIHEDENLTEQEIQNIIAIANTYESSVRSVVIGSDVLFQENVDVDKLLEIKDKIKAKIPESINITSSNPHVSWLAYSGLFKEFDVISVNIYPYWDGKFVEDAPGIVRGEIQAVQKAVKQENPDAIVIVGETGWPNSGPTICKAIASPGNQASFLTKTQELLNKINTDVIFFEAYDESWKTINQIPNIDRIMRDCEMSREDFNNVEKRWGIFDEDGKIKKNMMRPFVKPTGYIENKIITNEENSEVVVEIKHDVEKFDPDKNTLIIELDPNYESDELVSLTIETPRGVTKLVAPLSKAIVSKEFISSIKIEGNSKLSDVQSYVIPDELNPCSEDECNNIDEILKEKEFYLLVIIAVAAVIILIILLIIYKKITQPYNEINFSEKDPREDYR